LNVDIQVNMNRKDEIGQLLISMRHMVEKLNEVVMNVQGGAANVSSAARRCHRGCGTGVCG